MSYLEQAAAKATIAMSGLGGCKAILPLDVDKIVTTANMKVGAYTVAAQPTVPCRITVTHTAVGAADTLGTIVFVGTLPDDTVIQETVTPVASSTVSTVNEFKTVTSATGVGWVIGEGNDTITIGMGEVIPESHYFQAISNKIVASASMKVGAYTIAAQPHVPAKLTILSTAAGAADTQGTIAIIGVVDGVPTTETVTPIPGTIITTTNIFTTVYSVTGAGWVIGEGNDTIMVGTAEVNTATGYFFSSLLVLADAVVASQADLAGAVQANLTVFTKLPAGNYPCKLSAVKLTSGEAIGFLSAI